MSLFWYCQHSQRSQKLCHKKCSKPNITGNTNMWVLTISFTEKQLSSTAVKQWKTDDRFILFNYLQNSEQLIPLFIIREGENVYYLCPVERGHSWGRDKRSVSVTYWQFSHLPSTIHKEVPVCRKHPVLSHASMFLPSNMGRSTPRNILHSPLCRQFQELE